MIKLDIDTIDGELALRMEEAIANLSRSRPELAADILRASGQLSMLLALAADECRPGGDHLIVHMAASLIETQTEKLRERARQLYAESCAHAS